jgi:hypothetical protein
MERARRSTRLTLAALGIVVAAAIAIAVVAIAAARRVGGRSQPGRRRPVDGRVQRAGGGRAGERRLTADERETCA